MPEEIERIIITEKQIKKRVKEIAVKINRDYAGRELIMICVLRGALIFFTDLIRHITLKVTTAYMAVSSYGDKTVSGGSIRVQYDLSGDIKGKDVIVVEDIIDTGYTIQYILKSLSEKKPETLKVLSLLDKKARRRVEYAPDYAGFEIEDVFVVGYGLDYNEKYRNINAIGVLKKGFI